MAFNINKNTAYELIGRISPTVSIPVFIIGSGRCGTTLFVRILSSHGGLFSFPGEANDLWHPKSYPFNKRSNETPAILENPKLFTQISLESWPKGQINKIRNTFSGFNTLCGFKRQFFSKSAMLSFMIPNILAIFPDAKFIHIYRNGPSVVSSLIKKEWQKYSRYFANESEYRIACARYWNDCVLEIETRKKEMLLETKGQYYEFSYEQLCETPQ
ncbi:MAG: sulfotransferase, partial [Desulfamplus sp.]|nr:sulfotransferase [Desulfamplus sp.]